jgi:hypothetical protein
MILRGIKAGATLLSRAAKTQTRLVPSVRGFSSSSSPMHRPEISSEVEATLRPEGGKFGTPPQKMPIGYARRRRLRFIFGVCGAGMLYAALLDANKQSALEYEQQRKIEVRDTQRQAAEERGEEVQRWQPPASREELVWMLRTGSNVRSRKTDIQTLKELDGELPAADGDNA